MKEKRILHVFLTAAVMMLCVVSAFAAGSGDVSGAVESTWTAAAGQLKTIVNNVVFPALDAILAVFFFAKVALVYFDYRKHGQFDWAPLAILLACLIFTLSAPNYIWGIVGL